MTDRPTRGAQAGGAQRPEGMPATRRELLDAIREIVGEVADVPPDRRRYLLQSLGSVLQSDLEALYGVLAYLHSVAQEVGPPRPIGACACGAITTPGLLCPRCGTLAQ